MFKKTRLLIAFALLVMWALHAQDAENPAARFSFNNGKDYDEIDTAHKAKLVGINFTEDRFGNDNSAIFIAGNLYSYINLGNYKALKPRSGTISLWVKVETGNWVGKGARYNPIILTKYTMLNDYNESYGMYYILETGRLVALTSRDSLREQVLYSRGAVARNKWHHLAYVYNDAFSAFYLDGKLQQTLPKKFETKFLSSDSVVVGSTANKKTCAFLTALSMTLRFITVSFRRMRSASFTMHPIQIQTGSF
jgi:hypothetical protein